MPQPYWVARRISNRRRRMPMNGASFRIAVVAPGSPLPEGVAERVQALAAALYPGREPEIHFHPQCWLRCGHFAGDDDARAAAFVEAANDPAIDAVWIGRGGYGSCRIAERVLPELGEAARAKTYLGYSDAGTLLAGLYRHGIGRVAHGPMPTDIIRDGGEAAVARALAFLLDEARDALEPSLCGDTPAAAFNITILSHLLGTPLEPDLAGHVLMLEEVAEHHYRIDRSLFHITSHRAIQNVAGIRLGRCDPIPPNAPEFGEGEEEIVAGWCARAGIAYLGRADIGHDVENKVVPFGRWVR
jgi:muramoyltetrapeptide carboxypeptidase